MESKMIANNDTSKRIISFGEVLYDVFETHACLGGAPLNLSVHLHRLGNHVDFVSAVGDDDWGQRARAGIREQGLSDAFVATVPYETGRVTIALDSKKVPTYKFASNCAYDNIPFPEGLNKKADLFCFGTLAQRGNVSHATLHRILAEVNAPIFCDVNLRQNFFTDEILAASLDAADIVKLNEEELPFIANQFDFDPSLETFSEFFNIPTVILTLGPRGCQVYSGGELVTVPAWPAVVLSTVGAGDAFSAAFLSSFLRGKTIEAAAIAGNKLAAEVAAQQGAF